MVSSLQGRWFDSRPVGFAVQRPSLLLGQTPSEIGEAKEQKDGSPQLPAKTSSTLRYVHTNEDVQYVLFSNTFLPFLLLPSN